MTAFRRFGPEDVLDSVLTLHPRYSVSSGSTGWHGGPAGSASISVYGGARSQQQTFRSMETTPSWGSGFKYNLPTRPFPLTSSIRLVTVTPDVLTSTDISSTRWGKEHWNVIQGLYSYYSRFNSDYTTGSYDHYCLRFSDQSSNAAISTLQLIMSSTFTIEARIKPFLIASVNEDFTVLSRTKSFLFAITGSTGNLLFSSSEGTFVSTFGPSINRWSHVAVRCDGISGTFTVDLQDAGTFVHSSSFNVIPSYTGSLTAGAKWAGDLVSNQETVAGSGSTGTVFCGLMNELRVWNVCRTQAQLSASYKTFIPGGGTSASLPPALALYARFHDGPKSSYLGTAPGSSSVDEVSRDPSNSSQNSFTLTKFDDRPGPIWHPSDDISFIAAKQIAQVVSSSIDRMIVVNVPSMFYGRQIATGSVKMIDQAFSNVGIIRTIVDDGRGGLYISGSICSSSLDTKESYSGVGWNKIGNVFYSEGLIVIRDPSMMDFAGIGNSDPGASSHDPTNVLQLSFDGVSEIPTKTLMCRIDPGEMNCTTNPTFYNVDSDGKRVRRHASGSVYVTTVVLYDEDMEPVGIARLAKPLRHRSRDRQNIKLKIDF